MKGEKGQIQQGMWVPCSIDGVCKNRIIDRDDAMREEIARLHLCLGGGGIRSHCVVLFASQALHVWNLIPT